MKSFPARRSHRALIASLAFGSVAFIAGHSLSQPQPASPAAPAKPAEPPAMPGLDQIAVRLAEDSAPAPEHKVLEELAGSFKTEARMFIDPTEPPLVSHGATKATWILGNRFLKVESTVGAEKELKGESLTIYGFDTRTQKYTVLALDTFGTYWVSAEGDYNKDAKELRLTGTVEEAGQRIKFKWNVKIEDKKNSQVVLLNIQGDEWMKAAEVVHEKP